MKKSISFPHALANAEKFGIKYKEEENRWNHLLEIVYKGTPKEFFELLKKKAFVQITKPDGFDKESTSFTDIGVFVYIEGVKGVNVLFEVDGRKHRNRISKHTLLTLTNSDSPLNRLRC